MTIPRFSLAHDEFQAADSPKHLAYSTREFELPVDGPATFAVPFYHVVESPYEEFDDFTRPRACEVTLDRGSSTAAWHVDGRRIYETPGTVIAERVRIGIGIWTMLPIRAGRSRSLAGQGLSARFSGFRARGVEP